MRDVRGCGLVFSPAPQVLARAPRRGDASAGGCGAHPHLPRVPPARPGGRPGPAPADTAQLHGAEAGHGRQPVRQAAGAGHAVHDAHDAVPHAPGDLRVPSVRDVQRQALGRHHRGRPHRARGRAVAVARGARRARARRRRGCGARVREGHELRQQPRVGGCGEALPGPHCRRPQAQGHCGGDAVLGTDPPDKGEACSSGDQQGSRGGQRRRLPGHGEGGDHREHRALEPARPRRLPQRPQAVQRHAHARQEGAHRCRQPVDAGEGPHVGALGQLRVHQGVDP
mmetsp:Transcript_24166/g.82470  ORF Transcript_24166/g.82470 Transcript_24166/m.82470 type:complete len:283 (-) Transcript_24166:1197-2045(-)